MRSIYKTPVGGVKFPDGGYVLKSEIEETLDIGLSADQTQPGTLQILTDRYVEDLSATAFNLLILASQAPIAGTITVVSF